MGLLLRMGPQKFPHCFSLTTIYFRANTLECHILRDTLSKYVDALDQVINYDKSGLCFCGNVNNDSQEDVENILGLKK